MPSSLHSGTNTCCSSFRACSWVYFLSATHLDTSAGRHRARAAVRPRDALQRHRPREGLGPEGPGAENGCPAGARPASRIPVGRPGLGGKGRSSPRSRGSERPLGLPVAKCGLCFPDNARRTVARRSQTDSRILGGPSEHRGQATRQVGTGSRSPKALPWREGGRRAPWGYVPSCPRLRPRGPGLWSHLWDPSVVHPCPPGSLFPLHLSFLGCESDTRLLRFSPQVESPTVNQIKGSNISISPRTEHMSPHVHVKIPLQDDLIQSTILFPRKISPGHRKLVEKGKTETVRPV